MQYIIIFIGDQIVLGIARPDLLLLTINFQSSPFKYKIVLSLRIPKDKDSNNTYLSPEATENGATIGIIHCNSSIGDMLLKPEQYSVKVVEPPEEYW